MNFVDYDRISDLLMFFDNNIVLEFVVTLSSKDKNGNRLFFHSECDYNSNKYIGIDKGHSIKRRMTFYYVVSDKRAFDRSFIIRPEDAMMLSMTIKSQILPWYFDPKRNIFSVIEEQLRITGKYQDIIFAKTEYSYLRFQPCVYRFEDNTFKQGVRMYVSSETEFVDMEIDKFLGFYYFISRTDMYSIASNLATYVKTQPYGVNIYNANGLSGGGSKYQYNNPDIFTSDEYNEQETPKEKQMNTFFNRLNKKKKE